MAALTAGSSMTSGSSWVAFVNAVSLEGVADRLTHPTHLLAELPIASPNRSQPLSLDIDGGSGAFGGLGGCLRGGGGRSPARRGPTPWLAYEALAC